MSKTTLAYFNCNDQRVPGIYILSELSRQTQMTAISDIAEKYFEDTSYDYQIMVEYPNCYEDVGLFFGRRKAHKKVFYSIDPHLTFDTVKDYYTKYDLDMVFCSQKKQTEMLKEYGVKAEWLPFGAFVYHYFQKNDKLKRHYDIGFVGTYLDTPQQKARKDLLLQLYKEYDVNPINYVTPYDMRLIYASSKLGWNKSIMGELNMRTFEILATNTMMVTDEQDSMDSLLKGKGYVTYKDDKDMHDKIKYYLGDVMERERIAKEGFDEVYNNHTYRQRVEKMLKVLE